MDRLRSLVSRSSDPTCVHTDQIRFAEKTADVCPDCIEGGTTWVHLRLCLVCGRPGCCNSSPMQHSTRHYEATGHPLVKTLESWEDWAWCFEDEVFLKPKQYRRAARI